MDNKTETILSNKTFLVTGAGHGIGLALATELDSLNVNLILVDIDEISLREVSESLQQSPLCMSFDVSEESAWKDAKTEINTYLTENAISKISGIINNAGIAHDSILTENMNHQHFKRIMDVNFYGVLLGTETFLPTLKNQKHAWIVNVSSIFGSTGIGKLNAYCSSKFAVKGLTESLRMESKAYFPNITVCLVQPGGIQTDIANRALQVEQDNEVKRKQEIKTFNKQLRTSPQRAAKTIVAGIINNQERVLIGADAKLMDILTRLMPVKYTTFFLKYIQKAGLLND